MCRSIKTLPKNREEELAKRRERFARREERTTP